MVIYRVQAYPCPILRAAWGLLMDWLFRNPKWAPLTHPSPSPRLLEQLRPRRANLPCPLYRMACRGPIAVLMARMIMVQ